MPIPGSQLMDSIDIAYFLHSYRWFFRAIFIAIIALGSIQAFQVKRNWIPALILFFTSAIVYLFNFQMSADKMFLEPENVVLKSQPENKLPGDRLVIGIENNGEAKAYPVEFLAYHHQVLDNVGGKAIMVTYCSVCRTGRVYEPVVNGKYETFRLVGMNHFNAMFEDAGSGTWWRQVTGEAVAGEFKGEKLPELESKQLTVNKWYELYPHGKVMQADESFIKTYDPLARFERGKSKSNLTRTDSLSWKDKSWVVGIAIGESSKAYDWNYLKKEKIINDKISGKQIVLILSSDGQSFVAFQRPSGQKFTVSNDTLFSDSVTYNFSGNDLKNPENKLKSINAYQEFWHSWKIFHPNTERY